MVRLLLPLFLGLAAVGAAPTSNGQSGAPLPPRTFVPDHVLVLEVTARYPTRTFRRTVTRKGMRARHLDVLPKATDTLWLNLANGASARQALGEFGEHLQIFGPSKAEHRTPRRLDRTDRLLGETCHVWEVRRTLLAGVERSDQYCETADGIRLWEKTEDDGQMRDVFKAVSVVRRPVRQAEVMPPAELLSKRRLFGAATTRREPGFEVFLRSGNTRGQQVTRRSGSWSVHQNSPPLDGVTIDDRKTGLNFRLSWAGGDRAQELYVQRPAKYSVLPMRIGPRYGPPDAVVLGEPCWIPKESTMVDPKTGQEVVVTSNFYDDSCYSHDGILLRYERGHRVLFHGEATSFRRRPFSLDDILPRNLPLSLKAWGLN